MKHRLPVPIPVKVQAKTKSKRGFIPFNASRVVGVWSPVGLVPFNASAFDNSKRRLSSQEVILPVIRFVGFDVHAIGASQS